MRKSTCRLPICWTTRRAEMFVRFATVVFAVLVGCARGSPGTRTGIENDDPPVITDYPPHYSTTCGFAASVACRLRSSGSGDIPASDVNVTFIRMSDGTDVRDHPLNYSIFAHGTGEPTTLDVQLTIHTPWSPGDSRLFRCQASSRGGIAVATSNITLTPARIQTLWERNSTFESGTPQVELYCTFLDLFSREVELTVWRNGDKVVNGTGRITYYTPSTHGYIHNITIRLERPIAADAGVYTCAIETSCTIGKTENDVTLIMKLPDNDPPVITDFPPRYTVTCSISMYIYCHVRSSKSGGIPAVDVNATFIRLSDGSDVRDFPRNYTFSRFQNDPLNLYIQLQIRTPWTPGESKGLQCRASSRGGFAVANSNVTVGPATIIGTPTSATVEAGAPVAEMVCFFMDYSYYGTEVRLSVRRHGQEVVNGSNRLTVYMETHPQFYYEHTILIHIAWPVAEDAGQYTCGLESYCIIGRTDLDVTLSIPTPGNDPPVITNFPPHYMVNCGSTKHVYCYLRSSQSGGTPVADVNATFIRLSDGSDVRDYPWNYTVSRYPQDLVTLAVELYIHAHWTLGETKSFQCRASSRGGIAVANTNVTLGPAHLSAEPTNATVEAGAPVAEMVCSFSDYRYDTEVRLSVRRHGQEVVNGSNRLTFYTEVRRGYYHTILIYIAWPVAEDAGQYTCGIESPCISGRRDMNVTLTIQFPDNDPPLITDFPPHYSTTCYFRVFISCRLRSSASGDIPASDVSVTFIRMSDGTDVRDHSLNYSISSFAPEPTTLDVQLTIYTPWSQGESRLFRCQASSRGGIAVATSNITLTPARIQAGGRNSTFESGAPQVELYCDFWDYGQDRDVELTVWRHGDKVVNGTGRITYYFSTRLGYIHDIMILLERPIAADAGVYTCAIETPCTTGKTESDVTLIMKIPDNDPPVITDFPPRYTVTCSISMSIYCRLRPSESGGIPAADVNATFIRLSDGSDVRDFPRNYTVSRYQEDPLTLNVLLNIRTPWTPGESRRFKCRASSRGGIAVANSDVKVAPAYIAGVPTSATVEAGAPVAEMVCFYTDYSYGTEVRLSVRRHGQEVVNGTNRLTVYTENSLWYQYTILIHIAWPVAGDAGQYTCGLESPCIIGRTDLDVTLTIQGKNCQSAPCKNGGQCVEEKGDTFRCDCTGDYTGKHCETVRLPIKFWCQDGRSLTEVVAVAATGTRAGTTGGVVPMTRKDVRHACRQNKMNLVQRKNAECVQKYMEELRGTQASLFASIHGHAFVSGHRLCDGKGCKPDYSRHRKALGLCQP